MFIFPFLAVVAQTWVYVLLYFIYFYLFTLTANGSLPGGSGSTTRYNTQVTHITQNNTPPSNKTPYKTTQTVKDNANTVTTTRNTITTTINKK
jgi:hypothetical protein